MEVLQCVRDPVGPGVTVKGRTARTIGRRRRRTAPESNDTVSSLLFDMTAPKVGGGSRGARSAGAGRRSYTSWPVRAGSTSASPPESTGKPDGPGAPAPERGGGWRRRNPGVDEGGAAEGQQVHPAGPGHTPRGVIPRPRVCRPRAGVQEAGQQLRTSRGGRRAGSAVRRWATEERSGAVETLLGGRGPAGSAGNLRQLGGRGARAEVEQPGEVVLRAGELDRWSARSRAARRGRTLRPRALLVEDPQGGRGDSPRVVARSRCDLWACDTAYQPVADTRTVTTYQPLRVM